VPSQGVGGNGIASEFGDLTGMTRQEVDDFLRGLGAEIRPTKVMLHIQQFLAI